jgi:CRP-like cAMP-binding protein
MERYMMILKSIKRMNPELEQALRANVYPITIPKQVILRSKPEINDSLYFVEKGLLHYYYLLDNQEISLEFRWEDQFINIIESFNGIARDPDLEIETLENSILWCIPGQLVRELYAKYVRFSIQYLEISTRDYVAHINATRCSRPGAGLENFNQLCARFPQLLHRVPIHYLSNFTGIPEKELKHLLESQIRLHTDLTRRRRINPRWPNY